MNLIVSIQREILNPIIALLFVLALAYFLWGISEFVRNTSDSAREDGKRHMIWGVIGLFIMASVAGIVNILSGTFGIPGL